MHEPTNPSLLRGVERLHDGALKGDQAARAKLLSLRDQASDGDVFAVAALNTLAVVRFQKQDPRKWGKACIMVERIDQGDQEAMKWALGVQARAKGGDAKARLILGMLNACRDKNIASAWASPDVGAEDDIQNTRVRNLTSMTLGNRPSRAYAQGNLIIGGSDSVSAQVKKFLTLTPDVERKLTTMMLQGSVSKPASGSAASALSNVPLPAESSASQSAEWDTLTKKLPTTPAELEAYKAQLTDNSRRYSAGQMIMNATPALKAKRDQLGQGADWDLGYFIGIAASLGNTAEGPGQNAIRDSMFGDIPNEPMRGNLRNKGFLEARTLTYELNKQGVVSAPTTVKSLGRVGTRMTDAEMANLLANQGMCNQAESARLRKSPAYPGLAKRCAEVRRQNIMGGLYFADATTPNDPAYRVALTDAGEAIVSKNSQMSAFRASLPLTQQRGFTMAMGVRAGKVDPKFIAFVTPGLSVDPELLKGFLDGMKM